MARVLLCGWFSFVHGEATAGDVLSLDAVRHRVQEAGIPHDVAWSPVMRPPGGVLLEEVDPADYSEVVFVCGPAHGDPVRWLHDRFPRSRRLAVNVTVIDPEDPAVVGFDAVLARDAPGLPPRPDLAVVPKPPEVPVVGVVLAEGQGEYGDRRRHRTVSAALTSWLGERDLSRVPLETRLDPRDWRLADNPAQSEALVRRLDAVVTTRLHGLVLALKHGVPALAVDPVAGGGKVSAQAAAWGWPAVVAADAAEPELLDTTLGWCLSEDGTRAAQRCAADAAGRAPALLDRLLEMLTAPPGRAP